MSEINALKLKLFLLSALSLSALLICAVILLIRCRKRGAAVFLLAAAMLARAGHSALSVWIRYIAYVHPQRVEEWMDFRLSSDPHPPGLGYHVWHNMGGIGDFSYLLSYVFLIVLISFELRTRRDDKLRSDLKRELDHSI